MVAPLGTEHEMSPTTFRAVSAARDALSRNPLSDLDVTNGRTQADDVARELVAIHAAGLHARGAGVDAHVGCADSTAADLDQKLVFARLRHRSLLDTEGFWRRLEPPVPKMR